MIICYSKMNQKNGPILRHINIIKLVDHLLGGELVKSTGYKPIDEELYLEFGQDPPGLIGHRDINYGS